MTVTSSLESRDTGGTCLRWAVVERRCTELGATTDIARAELLGVARQTIDRWRHGRNGVALTTAVHVAHVLGVQLEQLLDHGGGPHPPSPPPPQPPNPGGPGRADQ